MKRSEEFRDLFVPWAGLAVGVAAAGIAHQFGSEGAFDDCATISPIPLILVCLISIAATIFAGVSSWRVVRDDKQGEARRVVAIVSVGSVALFVFAMILPIIASLVLPPCFQ
jgi:hypothetical protein